jgi:hypothetical protein
MASRMDRYNESKNNITRSAKHQNMYNSISSSNYLNYEKLPVSSNVNEIDINTLKKIATNRDEYRKLKELEDTMVIKRNKIIERKEEVKEEKIRDINELIEKARGEREKLMGVQEKISNTHYNFLNSLEANEDYEKLEKEKQKELDKLEMTRQYKFQTKRLNENPTIEQIMSDTAKLSLEILEDLKPSDNTVVTKPVSEEEKRNYEIKEMDKKEEKDSDFYSNTYTFSKKDFFGDGELDETKKSNIVWKVILVILTIVIIVLATIYALNYFNIDVIKFFK